MEQDCVDDRALEVSGHGGGCRHQLHQQLDLFLQLDVDEVHVERIASIPHHGTTMDAKR